MKRLPSIIAAILATTAASAETPPVREGELSSTRLLKVERLQGDSAEEAPDGLSFCFLVSRTPSAQYSLAIKETGDIRVSQQSYLELTKSALAREFEVRMGVHDASKYAASHPDVASYVSAAPERSLIVTLEIPGAPLDDGDDVEVLLHVGFGRSPGKPEAEDLIFTTKVPPK